MATIDDPRVRRTLQRVLVAAYDLLTEQGFGNVSIEDISRRSGVARSTLYRHWRTRDEIFTDAWSAHALEHAGRGVALADDLAHYCRTFAHGLTDQWGKAAATLAASALDDPEMLNAQAGFTERYNAELAAIVAAAVERGEPVIASLRVHQAAIDRLVGSLFYRYLFTHADLDEEFLSTEVAHACASLRNV